MITEKLSIKGPEGPSAIAPDQSVQSHFPIQERSQGGRGKEVSIL